MKTSKITTLGSLVISSLILLGSVWAPPVDARGFRKAYNRAHQVRGHKNRPSYRNHDRVPTQFKHYRKANGRAHQRYRAFRKNHYRRAGKSRQYRMRQYRMKRYRMRNHRREARSDRRDFRRNWRGFGRHRNHSPRDNSGFDRGRGQRGGDVQDGGMVEEVTQNGRGGRDDRRGFRQNRGRFGQN